MSGGWWLADAASQLLEQRERDAVRGDLIESGSGGWRALREILGLVARRQSALWMDWRPWLAMVAIVLPIGLMLSHVSRWLADGNAVYIAVYVRLWDWAHLGYPGWRRDVGVLIGSGTIHALSVCGWSWTTGYLLASVSRRTLWVTATLFTLVVLLGTFGTSTAARANGGTFAWHFYGVVFPRLIRALLVVVPALWGMRRASRGAVRLSTALWGAGALTLLTLVTAPLLEESMTLGRGFYPSDTGPDGFAGTADDPRPLWPLSIVMIWPTAYLVASAIWNREPRHHAA